MSSSVLKETSRTQSESTESAKTAGPGHPTLESLCDWLIRALPKCPTTVDALQLTMQRMVGQLNAPYCRISIESSTGSFDDERGAVESWGRLCKGQQLKARLGQTPVGRLYRSSASGSSFAVLTVPLRDRDRRVCGTATIVIPCDSHTVLRARLDEMAAVLALVHELSNVTKTSASSDATQARSDLTRIAKSTEYGSVQEFAFAFANTLKTKFDCEQVSLGIARGASIQLLCISGSDVLYPRAPGAAVIVHAMQECLDRT